MKKVRFPTTIKDKTELFYLKNDLLYEAGYNYLSLERFFEVLFIRKGVLHFQEEGEEHYYDNHYNGVVMFLNPHRPKCFILNRGFRDVLPMIKGHTFAISSPLTYIGRSRKGTNARYAFGFAIDLDGVGEIQLRWLLYNIKDTHTPRPNIIVNSGNGLHIYYLFEKPVALFPQSVKALQRLKEAITRIVWNKSTSVLDNDEDLQVQGIFQGFRLPETKTKFGTIVTAFYDEDAPLWTIRELNDHWKEKFKVFHYHAKPLSDIELVQVEDAQYIPSKFGIKEAEKLYPDWYEKRIVRGEKSKGWTAKRDLYEWYLGVLGSGKIKAGHRYFSLMCLSSFAIKCGISYEELRRDAFSYLEMFEEIKAGEDNHFTEEDIEDALKAYEENYRTFPRKTIEKLIGVIIPAPKRNYRKQEVHLLLARSQQDLLCKIEGTDWREGNGRPIATIDNSEHAKMVREWRMNNPNSSNKSQCARETGLSRPTVHKWWGELK